MPTATVDDIAPASVPSSGRASFGDIVASPDAEQAPSGLPSPDYVAQQTAAHAQTLTDRLMQGQPRQTSRWMADSPPPVPGPPITAGLQNQDDVNARQLQTQIDAPNLPAVSGWADRPLVPAPRIGEEGGPIATGIARGVTEFASGMTTPKNLGMLAGTWGLGDSVVALRSLGRLVSGGFSVSMLWQAAKQVPDLINQIRAGDTAGAAKTITSMGLGTVMAGASALHAVKASPKTAAPQAAANSTGTEPYKPPAQEPAQPVAAQPAHGTAEASDIAGPAQGTIESPGADTRGTPAKRPAAGEPAEEQGPAVSESPARVRGPGTGHETSVLIPDSDIEHKATYRLRELADLKASHHPFSFQENPDYPYTNDRDYTKAEAQNRVVMQAQKFNPRWMITDNPDAGNGPPIVDEDGNAIGGNSRVMTLARVYAQHPEAESAYRALLAKSAAHYGIDPRELASMRQPVLVREVSPGDAQEVQRAITDLNKTGTAKLGPSEQALVDSRRVSPETLDAIQHHIGKLGEDGSLAKALASDAGPEIVNRLVTDGAITERERPQYIADDRVTPEGKTRIGRLMIGRFFSDVKQFDETPGGIRNKLERIVSPLARLEQRPEWDASMNRHIRQGLRVLYEAGARNFSKLEDLDSQQGIFGATKFESDAYRWAYVLKNNSAMALGKAFRSYAELETLSHPDTTVDMFAPPPVPQAEAYAETIGKLKSIDRKSDVQAPPAASNPPDKPGPPALPADNISPASPPLPSKISTETPKPQDRGPVTMGMGLGAFEPFLRESIEDMRALKATRDAALEELERSKITTGEKHWGERVRHFFTATRDLWGARANQGIAKVRKLTYSSRNRRTGVDTMAESIAIAREFKGNPDELKSILGGYHPDLARIEDPKVYERVMDKIQALRPAIERALGYVMHSSAPDAAQMEAVDRFYTNMAETTAAEGKRTGVLHSEWNPETYVPHVLNPRGEGQYPGLRKAIGSALGGKMGKHFGFSQERSYPTLLHAIMADVIPKTMNIHDAFTIQQDHFARARATRLLEDQLRDTGVGKYTVAGSAPEGWKALASHANEFRQLVPYDTGEIDEEGNAKLETAEKRLFVPDFIADGLKAITAPDYTVEIKGKDLIRSTQAATKAAQLGLSLFHATTENFMALANMGAKGWAKALAADRDSGEFLEGERRLIRAGGTTAIQGNTVEAYKALSPGSIPTYTEIWRTALGVRQMDEAAAAISDFTFNNMQRRFKVTDFMLHRAAWMAKHPNAMQGELLEAERGMAKEVNAIYGGLHWENIGLNKATVEISRALMLAPDWTISNVFSVKYAFEKGPAGSMARMFWIRTLVGGMVATQAASLMFSRHFSKRPTMVYMGKDVNGEDIYQNIFFKGAPGDATNLVTNVYDYGLEGIFRTMAGKGSPTVRTGLQLATNKDYLGHEIAPKGMNPLASSARTAWSATKSLAPIPLSLTNQVDMLFGPEAHKYTWPERLTTMFSGNPPSHVAPPGTHLSGGILRPNAEPDENSVLDQLETGRVYRSRNGRTQISEMP